MRKGLQLTLMSVAIALFGLQSMTFAMAPVIGNVPDVVIGDMENTTQPNTFVFPDAFDLGAYVADPDTPDQSIIWTYAPGTPPSRYLINGVQPLDLSTEDVVNPPTAKRIGSQVLNGEDDRDSNAQTVTFRDQTYTPFGGPNVDPGSNGIVASQALTLFASDGTETDSQALMVYSDNGGRDRLSGAGVFDPGSDQLVSETYFYGSQTNGFTSTSVVGTVTFTVGANGVSIGVPAGATTANPNIGTWSSPNNFIQLVNNSIWRVRAEVTSDVTTAGTVPFWDIVINNTSYAFGTDFYFLDNVGAANAAGSLGRTNFEVWYTPLPMGTSQFAGVFDAAQDPYNDMNVMFRVLDGNENIGSQLDAGTLTMSSLEVDRFDISRVTSTGNVFNAATITDGTDGTVETTDFNVTSIYTTSTTSSFSGGVLTVAPVGTAWTDPGEAVNIQPGDGTGDLMSNPSALADDYPILWETNTLYRVQAIMSVPNATPGESNPPDVITVGMDSPTNEVINVSYMTAALPMGGAAGSYYGVPKTTSATYQMFYFSHNATNETTVNANRLRPRVQVLNSNTVTINGITSALGSVNLHSVVVDKVDLP